jgi:type II secretory pathway pseudopilin PulG
VREVEDARASQSSARLSEKQQRARTEAAAGKAALSLARHRHGLFNFLEVADAQQKNSPPAAPSSEPPPAGSPPPSPSSKPSAAAGNPTTAPPPHHPEHPNP